MNVCVFGYSENVEKYSHKAALLLQEFHHEVYLINPRLESDFAKITKSANIHTLTLYVNSSISDKYQDYLLEMGAKRVIFNPGTENYALQKKFETLGVDVVVGCTLVLLRTHQF